MDDSSTALALLHVTPQPGEIERNKAMVASSVRRASAMGAKLAVCPELVVSGYGFRDVIGTDWIARDQEALFAWAGSLTRETAVSLVLGMPEADPASGLLFNSMIVIGPDGSRIGRHHKINVLRVGSESWSAPGNCATVVAVAGIGRLGLFVCADMFSQRLVRETESLGVDLLISSAAWAPGEHGPNGEWEWASGAAATPVLVCNRSGVDVLDFREARSVAAVGGAIVWCHASPESAIILVDWNRGTRELTNWRITE